MTINKEDIINFWFDPAVEKQWFSATQALDEEMRLKFESSLVAALENKLHHWEVSALGSLALVILLDQFPLNMYRGESKSFAGEQQSREVAQRAITQGFDQQLTAPQKAFLYMPFMHSENIDDQQLSVDLFEAAGLDGNLRFAKHHYAIIKRFGRFPHRNKILGRESTIEEREYLNSKEAFHG